jgi:primosomal protein N' (replication factor Y)
MVGAGTERIAADIQRFLNVEPLRFDADAMREDRVLRGLHAVGGGNGIIVGTRAVTGRLRQADAYRLCVFLNPDTGLNVPDFRSSELLFQEIVGISEYVRRDGSIIVQTKMPENDLFRYIKTYNIADFFAEELARRRSLAYPPFSRMIAVTLSSGVDVQQAVTHALPLTDDKIEIIGPFHQQKRERHIWKVIFKSTAKERLRLSAKKFLNTLKSEKNLRIAVDVDPISL